MDTSRTLRDLTTRQQEIVRLRCHEDLTILGVARSLGVTEQTVKNHCSGILDTLGVTSFQRVCFLAGYEAGQMHVVAAQRPEMV